MKRSPYLDTAVAEPIVDENSFIGMEAERAPLPGYDATILPSPEWEGHAAIVDCYWKAWQIAFGNLRQPQAIAADSPLIANFIDTAFNDATFMWDSAFMTMFGRYGSRAFNFQRTLDNFYAMQHRDGFISREIIIATGMERFEKNDVSSTGPNIFPWAEWEYFRQTGDTARLARVFPPLAALTRWFRKYRTWPDGSYFSSGLGCGMDNQPRLTAGYKSEFDHGHASWIDTTLQAILANRTVYNIAREIGRADDAQDFAGEADFLTAFVNERMWNDPLAFYTDRFRDGRLSGTKTIGAYWALLAGIVPPARLAAFLAHLSDPKEFNRFHRVPSLAADHPRYSADGGYWLGGVWAPTNYMVLRGLTANGADGLAHEIALNHVSAVAQVFQSTGTVFENYAPEFAAGGNPARRDFVGWTGVSPITILFEYVFGLRPDARRGELLWDVRLMEAHGVKRYPFGTSAVLTLHCARRGSPAEEPVITAMSNEPVRLVIRWAGGEKVIHAGAAEKR